MPETLSKPNAISLARQVIQEEMDALARLLSNLNGEFERAIDILEQCQGRVVITGMGKSGIIGRKMAATFSSTGTAAYFLHPAEGMHGDLGMMRPGDVVIAISNSGETSELLHVLPVVKHFGLPLIAMTGNPNSTLATRSDVTLDISVSKEACPLNLAPTASTTVSMVMGDALAITLMERKGFSANDFALFHPAGSLGKRLLLTVAEVMHAGEELPVVFLETPFKDALVEITSKKLGMTLVLDEAGKTCGIVTDGDVRRALGKDTDLAQLRVEDVCTWNPKSIHKEALAATALSLMEQHKITVLCVNQPDGVTEGIIHLHDLLKTGI